jgi:glutamate dehydrogenase (NAD(P)+)
MIATAVPSASDEAALPAPRLVWEVRDGHRPLGAVVVDELVASRSCGGLRIAPTVTRTELRELASVMTAKFAFFRIACGGAKAGLQIPEDASVEDRQQATRAFGAALAPLVRVGTYVPGTDLGCTERDLWDVLTGAGLHAGLPPTTSPVETSATASFSGRSAAIAALAALGEAGDATLAVLGYGRVGAALARRFAEAGGRLIAASTACGAVVHPRGLDVARLDHLRSRHGDEALLHYPGARRVPPEEILGLGVDVVAPCATSTMLDVQGARALRCQVIAPGANAAVTPAAERALAARGITVLPDFVANAGGVLVSHFWPLPLSAGAIAALLERRFRAIVEALLARAAAERTAPPELARKIASRNLARLRSDHRLAVRHELVIARLARGRLRRALPPGLVTLFVARVARSLGPHANELVAAPTRC